MFKPKFNTSKKPIVLFHLLAVLLWVGCQQAPDNENDELPVLKEAFKDDFLIGAALNVDQIIGNDINGAELVKTQYNTITPENILKWGHVHPQPDSYNFDVADQYVQFGEKNGMFIDVMVTELDIDVLPSANDYQGADISTDTEYEERLNPWPESLPDSVQDALSQRYAELFNVYYEYRDVVTRITFWGVSDGDSWKNNWPVRGRTNYPLLFDRKWQPKPAFYSVTEIES